MRVRLVAALIALAALPPPGEVPAGPDPPAGSLGLPIGILEPAPAEELRALLRGGSVAPVRARTLDHFVAYARMPWFARGSAAGLRRALDRLLDRGATAIVLDLRGNHGGLTAEAVRVAGLFVGGGVVGRIAPPGGGTVVLRATGRAITGVPVAVLVDGGTASAAELVAGALQDMGRATIVGTRTFGKGSVWSVGGLDGEGPATREPAGFLVTPSGHGIHGAGIVPDVTVYQDASGDAQLERALALVEV